MKGHIWKENGNWFGRWSAYVMENGEYVMKDGRRVRAQPARCGAVL